MKQTLLVVAAVVLLAAVMVGLRLWSEPEQTNDAAVTAAPPAVESPPVAQEMFGSVPVDDEVISDSEEPEPPLPPPSLPPEPEAWKPDPQAVEALRQSRLHGDPRTPPIARPETTRELPTEEELADPDLYLEYEARQQQQVYASFLDASKKKISDLEAIIERGKQGGVSPEQLAEGEEKLRRLKQMREQLLAEHPDLAAQEQAGSDAAQEAEAP